MGACVKCGRTRHTVGCSTCGEMVCPDCQPAPSTDVTAAVFETHCSEDCRDGTHTRLSFGREKCPDCEGRRKVRKAWGRGQKAEDCRRCGATGEVYKAAESRAQSREARGVGEYCKDRTPCDVCFGKYQFNTATCQHCTGTGFLSA